MKKYILGFVLIIGLTILSCSDDFTTTAAVGSLSDTSLNNPEGVNLLLTGAYSTLTGVRVNGIGNGFGVAPDSWTADVVSDDAHKGSTDDDQAELRDLEIINWGAANGYFSGRWGVLFAGVNRSNAVINLINSIEGQDLSAQMAEARFLRGHFNFEIQRLWGNVPLITEDNASAIEFNQPNSGPIWDAIEADFQFAIDNLPASQSDIGRPTLWAASAYLGKTHLYQSEFNEASAILNNVVNNGPYSLLPEYVDNFRSNGETGPEAVFAIQFVSDAGQSLNGNVGGTLNFPGGGPFGSCCGFYQPTQDLLNAFQVDENGLPLIETFNQTDVASDFGITSAEAFTPHTGPLDPRADYTVGRRGIDYNGYGAHPGSDWIRAGFSDLSGPYLPKKNVYTASDASNVQGTGAWGQQHSGLNFNIIRYADVLLMAAEAAAETGDLGTALANVNAVRNRAASMTPVQAVDGSGPAANYLVNPYPSFGSQAEAVAAVRFERRVELGMEGNRLFDLNRWGITPQVLNEYFVNEARTIENFGQKVNSFQAFNMLWPIPQQSIDFSEDQLTHNPGY